MKMGEGWHAVIAVPVFGPDTSSACLDLVQRKLCSSPPMNLGYAALPVFVSGLFSSPSRRQFAARGNYPPVTRSRLSSHEFLRQKQARVDFVAKRSNLCVHTSVPLSTPFHLVPPGEKLNEHDCDFSQRPMACVNTEVRTLRTSLSKSCVHSLNCLVSGGF